MSQRGLPQRREIVSSLILSPFSPPLHYWKGHAARHSGRLPVVQLEGGGGYRGLMRWRIPTECLHRQILIKNSSVSSFVSSSALWPFFYLFHSSRKSSLPWSDTSFTFVLAVKVETVQCGLDAAHPESGGGEYGYLLPGWDLLLNWLLAQKWRNWKDNLVMQVCR